MNASTRLPHVAVVVPCYNYGRFLVSCIESIVGQTGVETSVHVIDDASPDGSFGIALELAARYRNVRATRNLVNLGHIATYNKGLAQVDSDYVVLLSADDQLAPGALARAAALMEAHPKVGLVYGHPQTFSGTPKETSYPLLHWSLWSGRNWTRAQFRRGLSIIYSPEAVVRTELQHQVGYYRADLPHSGDLEMWLRLAAHADVGRVNGPDQAYRRLHPLSMMNSEFAGVLTDLRERQRAYEACLESESLSARERGRLEATMRRRLSMEALGWAVDASRAGTEDSHAISEAVDFGREVYPEYLRLDAWKEFAAGTQLGLIEHLGRSRRELGDRLRWQRWRRFGV
ncbi:glycosyltransferase family 2 protein [Arthrobacter sp. 92]|uniref:glycosyltransferase family 2 protein n=1 Tax=Arthrobacter sp. 92 TaxID=3418175 RepID=UPI003CFE19D8